MAMDQFNVGYARRNPQSYKVIVGEVIGKEIKTVEKTKPVETDGQK